MLTEHLFGVHTAAKIYTFLVLPWHLDFAVYGQMASNTDPAVT